MRQTGPPAKTTEQKKMQGTYRQDRDQGDNLSFAPFEGIPDPPPGLKGEAKTVWSQAVRILSGSNMLYEADFGLIREYARVSAMLRKAGTSIKYNSMVCDHVNKSNQKNRVIAPEILLYDKLLSQYNMLCNQLGFSPQARMRLRIQAESGSDEFLDLLKKKAGK